MRQTGDTPPPQASAIGPLRAHSLLATYGIDVAPALVAAIVVGTHTGRIGDALIVAASMLLVAWVLEPGRTLSRLMPVAGIVAHALLPLAGLALAVLLKTPFGGYEFAAIFPAALASLAVLAVGGWILTRFERRVELRTVFVGDPRFARSLARELEYLRTPRIRVLGWVDGGWPDLVPTVARLGSLGEIGRIVDRERIDLIINGAGEEVAIRPEGQIVASKLDVTEAVAARCLGKSVRLIGVNQFYEELFGHVAPEILDAAYFQYLMHPRFRAGSLSVKRATDILGASAAGLLALPFFGLAALALRLIAGAPVLVSETRIGERGREFEVLKLRTLDDDGSAGKIARLVHRARLDAVPALLSVVRGQMSLVGPRPERPSVVANLEWQIPFYDRRELVKPGITGWAQLRCADTPPSEGTGWKLTHDLYYLKHRSLAFDLMIILQTVVSAVADVRIAVSAPDEALSLGPLRSN